MILKKMLKLAVLSASLCAAFGMSGNAAASGDVIKIGFITDMSGTYADFDGQGGVEAIKMAIADAGGQHQWQEDRTGRRRPSEQG